MVAHQTVFRIPTAIFTKSSPSPTARVCRTLLLRFSKKRGSRDTPGCAHCSSCLTHLGWRWENRTHSFPVLRPHPWTAGGKGKLIHLPFGNASWFISYLKIIKYSLIFVFVDSTPKNSKNKVLCAWWWSMMDPTFDSFLKTLTQKGHQVLTFEKPRHAIEDIQGNPEKYDASFWISGCRRCQAWNGWNSSGGHQHPVVLVSGQTDIEEAQDLVNLDLDAMLLKPFNSETLKKVLIKLETTCNSKETGHDSRSFPPESNETLAWKMKWWNCWTNPWNCGRKNTEIWRILPRPAESGNWPGKRIASQNPETLPFPETLPMRPKWRQVIDTSTSSSKILLFQSFLQIRKA